MVDAKDSGVTHPPGLYRTTIAGPGRSLVEAFDSLEQGAHVGRLLRHPKRDLLSGRVTLTPEEGQGYWELTRIRQDLYIIQANFAYKDPRFEFVPGDGLVQFNFMVSGDMTYGISRPGPLRFTRPAVHLWRQPRGVDMREWTAPHVRERVVTISVRPDFLVEHFLASRTEVPARVRAFVSEPGDAADFCQVPLTAQMLDVTNKILNNPYSGSSYLMYKEALTLELLCVAMESLLSTPEPGVEEYSERELRAVSAARQLLMERFESPPTQRGLARLVGIGEKALTRVFKAVYGETLCEFGLRCRMLHALTLLRDWHWSVDRASEAVGYSHPTTFATAFRKHFGIRPMDAKQRVAPPAAPLGRGRGVEGRH